MGGTITGEHGVGVEKLNSMCVQFTAAENAQMFALKAAFDPAGLLNPAKLISHAEPLCRVRQDAGARRQAQPPGFATVLIALLIALFKESW